LEFHVLPPSSSRLRIPRVPLTGRPSVTTRRSSLNTGTLGPRAGQLAALLHEPRAGYAVQSLVRSALIPSIRRSAIIKVSAGPIALHRESSRSFSTADVGRLGARHWRVLPRRGDHVNSSWILAIVAALAERRYARRASKELLELLRMVQTEQPELSGRALYQAVITRRLGANQKRAGEIVRRAEESFTDWPSERELRFRDVVHYQVFDEFTHSGPGRDNTRTNMGRVVARIIPEQL